MILIRECDWSVLIVICKTPHKMNCSNPPPENDKKDVCRSAYDKRYYAENRERFLARQKRWRTENLEAMKARNRRWYENNKERLASSRKNNIKTVKRLLERLLCPEQGTKTKTNRTEYHAF